MKLGNEILADHDEQGVSPEMADALAHGDLVRMAALLRKGVSPNSYTSRNKQAYSVLFTAAGYGNVAAVELLLVHGAHPDRGSTGGSTPLFEAAGHGDLAVAKRLLAAGANPNAFNRMGVTALLEAVTHRRPEMVGLLLQHGANPHGPPGCASPLANALDNGATKPGFEAIVARIRKAQSAWEGQRGLNQSVPAARTPTSQTAHRL